MAENQITIELGKSINVTLGDNEVTVKATSVDALKNYVDAGDKIYLNGNNGNSYLWYNEDESAVELWANGIMKRRWK